MGAPSTEEATGELMWLDVYGGGLDDSTLVLAT